jgi:hypothetical protein
MRFFLLAVLATAAATDTCSNGVLKLVGVNGTLPGDRINEIFINELVQQ